MRSSRAPAVFFGTLRSHNPTWGREHRETPSGAQRRPREGVYCRLRALLKGQIPAQHQLPLSNARNVARAWLPRNSAGVSSPPCLPQTPDRCLRLGQERPPCRAPLPPSRRAPSRGQPDSLEPAPCWGEQLCFH